MKTKSAVLILAASLYLVLGLLLFGCDEKPENPKAGAPPPAVVEPEMDITNFKVAHPEQFPLAPVTEYKAPSSLNVTGVVNPDIARAVPVISLAAGRVVELRRV